MPAPPDKRRPAASASGEHFGKYTIVDRIAAGGMAEIYRARIDGEGGFRRTFALKRILPHLSSRAEFVDMLVEEAKIAGLLSHANIVQIMDLGQVDGQYYIAMEYVAGPDLGRVLARCRDKGISLPVPHAVFIAIEVLKALEYAHTRRVLRGGREMPLDIVHRDISPANVLVSLQGEVKLTDFGIAKASVKALETVSGVIKGRFDYLSPEQAGGGKADPRSDLFAVGVLLYETLTGRHPFRKPAEGATIDAIRDGDFAPPTHVNPDVPYPLERILERALAVDPDERFASATEFKEALDRFFHDAGFIFSHSTLAAFLAGLFPEEVRQRRRRHGPRSDDDLVLAENAPPAPLGPADPDSAEAETRIVGRRDPSTLPPDPTSEEVEDRPTEADVGPAPSAGTTAAKKTAAKKAAAKKAAARKTADPARGTPSPEDVFPGLDSTVRRPPTARPPTLDDLADMPEGPGVPAGIHDVSTVIRPGPADDWEAETVIRNEADVVGRLPAGGSVTQPAPDLGARPTSLRDRPGRPPARTGASWRLHVLYLALVVVVGVGMLFAGVFLARLRLQAMADPGVEAAAIKREPRLQVTLPEGAALRVDGRTVPGPSPIDVVLSSGESHQVEVTAPGAAPVRTEVRLEPGEERILSIQVEQLRNAPR